MQKVIKSFKRGYLVQQEIKNVKREDEKNEKNCQKKRSSSKCLNFIGALRDFIVVSRRAFYRKIKDTRAGKRGLNRNTYQRKKTNYQTPVCGCLSASVFFLTVSARYRQKKESPRGNISARKSGYPVKKNTTLQPPAAAISMSAEKPSADKENRKTVRKENCIDFLGS